MRPLLLAAALALLPLPAAAEGVDASALIAAEGLRGAEAALAALPDPTPSDRFALGGVRVLAAVEGALQLRWRAGMSQGMAMLSGLPLLRLPIPENPAPAPFDPASVESLFRTALTDLAAAREALSGIADDDAVAVVVRMDDLWFDIDADGARGPGEGVLDVAGTLLMGGNAAPSQGFAVRFDTADAAWLMAYAHLLSGVSEGVLALDPTSAIARVAEARAGFAELGPPAPSNDFTLETQFGDMADLIATVVMAIEGQPDPARTRAARDHFLAMASESRRFWTLVAREADDDREWIPNKAQTSATGLPFPPETGTRWLAVLAEGEAVLRGERLIPFWRVGAGAGLDLHALMEDPPAIDLAGLIQGATLLPYLRRGPLASAQALRQFDRMVQGDSVLYAVVLN
jgi:hypothetical protein